VTVQLRKILFLNTTLNVGELSSRALIAMQTRRSESYRHAGEKKVQVAEKSGRLRRIKRRQSADPWPRAPVRNGHLQPHKQRFQSRLSPTTFNPALPLTIVSAFLVGLAAS